MTEERRKALEIFAKAVSDSVRQPKDFEHLLEMLDRAGVRFDCVSIDLHFSAKDGSNLDRAEMKSFSDENFLKELHIVPDLGEIDGSV